MLRVVKTLVQSHSARRWRNWDLTSCLKVVVFSVGAEPFSTHSLPSSHSKARDLPVSSFPSVSYWILPMGSAGSWEDRLFRPPASFSLNLCLMPHLVLMVSASCQSPQGFHTFVNSLTGISQHNLWAGAHGLGMTHEPDSGDA